MPTYSFISLIKHFPKHILKRRCLIFFALCVLFSKTYALDLSESASREQLAKPASQKIVVSLKPYALLMESIKHEGDEISILLEDGANAHDFQLKPSHLKKIAEADLVIWSGEDAEPNLVKALKNKKNQLVLMDIKSLDLINTADDHEENALNNHQHLSVDPHIWFSQANALLITLAMADALHYSDEALNNIRMHFAQNQAIESTKNADKNNETAHNSALLVYHNAYAYLEKDLKIQHEFVINESHNTKPSLRHWNALKESLQNYKKNNRSVCIISLPNFENSSEAKQLDALLNKTDMKAFSKIVEIDPLASSANYNEFYRDSKNRLLSCLGN